MSSTRMGRPSMGAWAMAAVAGVVLAWAGGAQAAEARHGGHAHEAPTRGGASPQAASPAHDAHGGHDAPPPKLALDHGRKWATDEPLRRGMGQLRGLIEPRLPEVHAGQITERQYAELAGQVDAVVADIVASCKLEPRADAMLHRVVADLLDGSRAMAGEAPGRSRTQGFARVVSALNGYAGHFDHPGFKRIRMAH